MGIESNSRHESDDGDKAIVDMRVLMGIESNSRHESADGDREQ